MAMVCSPWADRAAVGGDHGPAVVEQPASRRCPAFTMGSTASTLPGPQHRAPPGRAVVGHLGLLVHGGADAVADVLAHHREPGRLGHRRSTAWPMSPTGGCPRPSAAMPAARPASVTSISRAASASTSPTPAVKAASPCQPSTMAPQSIEMMSPSSRRRRRGCRARSRRSARRRSPPGSRGSRGSSTWPPALEHLAPDAVELGGGHARGGWPPGSRSCISATTRPALRIERPARRRCAPAIPRRLTRRDAGCSRARRRSPRRAAASDLVGRAHAVDDHQLAAGRRRTRPAGAVCSS